MGNLGLFCFYRPHEHCIKFDKDQINKFEHDAENNAHNDKNNEGSDSIDIKRHNHTSAADVINFFESSFADKQEIPESLERLWLRKAIARYSIELDELIYDSEIMEFNQKLDDYTISLLGQFMLQFYQERQVSLVNKRVSIVGKDISIDGANGQKTAEKNHLQYISSESLNMIDNIKPTAYN